jgi:signal transduction histidine kinase/CheY-like chemotaxis protein
MPPSSDDRLKAYVDFADGRRVQPFINLLAALMLVVVGNRWPMVSWWAITLCVVEAAEVFLADPRRWRGEASDARINLGYSLCAVTILVFSVVDFILWKYAGVVGAAAAMVPTFYALMAGLISSRGKLAAFLSLCASSLAAMLALPVAVYVLIRPDPLLIVLFLGEVLVGWGAFSAWRWMAKMHGLEQLAQDNLIEARERAEAANEAKSAFVAMVSHELRTPISAIVASANDLDRQGGGGARSNAQLIVNACGMLRTLLNDLLDFSKIEAGQLSVEAIVFDPRTLIVETLRLWRAEARKKGVRLRLEGGHRLPDWVQGDPMRLRQILNNLLSNAAKFTDEGAITLTIEAEAGAITFRVSDTGPGMTAEQLSRLFTPFDQLAASTARKHGGTGLGLSISRNLARLMRGDLTAASRPGQGASFTLRLPMEAVAAPVASAPVEAPVSFSEGERLRLLVVDDHEINRMAIEVMLRPLGADLTMAIDGEAALAAAARQGFDAILMDVRMPGLNGLEAARMLRDTDGPNRHTPVIAVTGDGSPGDIEACRRAGMTGHVLKPIDPAQLYTALASALEGAPAETESVAA